MTTAEGIRKQFLCMKWGTVYSADYVNRLYSMIKRHTTSPFTLYCLTDDAEGIDADVQIRPCPVLPNVPPPLANSGWRKLVLWAPEVSDIHGECLFLDLDIIITGNIDDFFSYRAASDYVVMRNYTTPIERNIGNTSVFRFTVGSHPYLYDRFIADPKGVWQQHRISQQFISSAIKNMEFWPDLWIRHFKTHCVPRWPLRFFIEPKQIENTKIVVCTGHPRPHEVVSGTWPAPWYKKIYKKILPAEWVRDAWR